MKKLLKYFTPLEWCLWLGSITLLIVAFLIFKSKEYTTLISSLFGVTAIIFSAKGNPIGPALMVVFCIYYGIISYFCRFYGETATYVGMTLPMTVFSLIAWLRNPYKNQKSVVTVNKISGKEHILMWILAIIVSIIFYFILKYFNTANLIVSTFSITTSFIAVYLSFRRSPYFSLGYAANDIVLIILWLGAALKYTTYIAVVVCFCTFLINDLYCFISWLRLQKIQSEDL